MSKVRVYEVAKQLNMDQKALVTLFQSMGMTDVKNHMSAVEPDVVDRVKRHLEKAKAPSVTEERIRPTVVKRRREGGGAAPGGEAGEWLAVEGAEQAGQHRRACPGQSGLEAFVQVGPQPPERGAGLRHVVISACA